MVDNKIGDNMRINKKTVISITLCLCVFVMAIGYSLLSSSLKITGQGSITSTWDVRITDITNNNAAGSAYNLEAPSFTNDTAKFRVGLVDPGDSMTYTVKIENKGTITAILNMLNITTSGTDAIIYEVSGIKEGDTLAAGATINVYVTARYNSNVIADPDERVKTLTVGLEWIQYSNQVITPGTYTINYNANGGSGSIGSTTCTVGSSCTLASNTFTNSGFVFKGWSTSSDGTQIYSDAQTVMNLASSGKSVTLYAVWGYADVVVNYTVNITPTGGSVTPSNLTVSSGESVSITLLPNTGFIYSSNTCGGTVSGNTMTISNITADKNCQVVFVDAQVPEQPTITRTTYNKFSYLSVDNVGATQYYVSKDSSTKPTASASGWTTSTSYTINGAGTYRVWSKDAAGNVSALSSSIVAYTISRSQGANTTLTTRYDSTSSSTGTAFTSNTAMLAGTSVWASATASSGYTATLKRGSTTMTASGSSFTVSSEQTITSSATAVPYTVRVTVSGGGGSVSPSSQTVASGGSVTVTISPSLGYDYDTYTKTSGSASVSVSGSRMTISNVTSDVSIVVYFEEECDNCPYGGTLQSNGKCRVNTYSSTTVCDSCSIPVQNKWCCDQEDRWCSPPSDDYYGEHTDDNWNGGSYVCYYYDTYESITSCSECGESEVWSCPAGSLIGQAADLSYGICEYNMSGC